MSDDNTLKPQHLSYQTDGTNSTHTNLTNPQGSNAQGYQGYTSEGTNSTHTNLRPAGYTYILNQNIVTSVSETIPQLERPRTVEIISTRETWNLKDSGDTNPALDQEPIAQLERASTVERISVKELYLLSESATAKNFVSGADLSYPTREIISTTEKISPLREPAPSKEKVSVTHRITYGVSVKFNGLVHNLEGYTSKFHSLSRVTNGHSVEFHGLVNQLVATAAATGTGPLGDSNVFNPSSVLNSGTVFGTPPASPPSGLHIFIPNTGITGVSNWKDLLNWGISLNFNGGTFDIGTKKTFGSLGSNGDVLSILGFTGTITDAGRTSSSSFKGYNNPGIFGSPKLNKQFRLIAASNILSAALQNGISNEPLTARTIANIVANVCDIKLVWQTRDVLVKDFSYEPTMNGVTALNSLAQRVGGTLRWYGNDTYYIAYPPFSLGRFEVPNYRFLGPNGITDSTHEDLETGVGGAVNVNAFGTPVQSVEILNYFGTIGAGGDGSIAIPTNNGIQALGFSSPLRPITGPITKKLTDSDPANYYDLPPGYQDIYAQILINGKVYSNATTAQYVTTNPETYDIFVPPSGGGTTGIGVTGAATSDYIFQVYEGGAYKTRLKIDHNVFPDHPAVNNNNFQLNLACTMRSPQATTNDGVVLLPPEWVQTYKGTIECLFFGVIPLPGMWGYAKLDDHVVEGVIESVSLTHSGIMTIQVAQYTRINWISPYIRIQPGL